MKIKRGTQFKVLTIVLIVFVLLELKAFFEPPSSLYSSDVNSTNKNSIRSINTKANKKASAEKDAANDNTTNETFIMQPEQQQLAEVAQAYKNNIQFPSYSKPLSPDDWNLLNPRPFVAKTTPLEDLPELSASIELDHYVMDQSKDLGVRVILSSSSENDKPLASAGTSVDISVIAKQQRTTAITLNTPSQADGALVFSGTVPASEITKLETGEAHVLAQIKPANENTQRITATFKLYDSEAELISVGDAYVDGAHLMIPLHFDVEQSGYYKVRANLFGQQNGKPISHLNAAFSLSSTNNTATLKVHAATLREMQDAGPYVISDFDISRSPAKPGDTTGYGSTSIKQFEVNGFDLDSYSHEDYQDPTNKQRLEFLEKVSQSSY